MWRNTTISENVCSINDSIVSDGPKLHWVMQAPAIEKENWHARDWIASKDVEVNCTKIKRNYELEGEMQLHD